jgi:hypothetical protein
MTSARTIGRRALVVSAATLLVGCNQSGPSVPAEPSSVAPGVAGIVVVSFEEPSSPVVGFIDPSTGRYVHGATLNIAPQSFAARDRGSIAMAPDWSRFAVTRPVDGMPHAGWVDPQSKFTDVTSSPNGTTTAIGFDGMGNFFYRTTTGGASSIIAVPNGQTSGAEPVSYVPKSDTAVLKRDGTGRLVDVSACPTFAATWVSPTDYVHVSPDRTQIYRTNVIDTYGLRGCDAAIGNALLPTDDTGTVSEPVASPDGQKVAYLRNDSELWVVDASGTGTPTRLNVSGIDLGTSHKTMLAGWTAPNFTRPPSFSQKPDLAGTWTGDYFGPALKGTGSAAFHVDRSDPLSGSIVTKAGDLTCNSAAKETKRTADSFAVAISLKPGADPRCKGSSTVEFAWLGDRLSGVITQSSEASYVGGTLIVRRQ